MILIPPLWTDAYAIGFSFFGITILYGAFLLVRSIMTDRESRTIVRIFAAPVTTFQYLFQNLLGYLVLLMAQILIFVLIGSLLYGWQASIARKLVLGYGIFAAASIAFSLAWNSGGTASKAYKTAGREGLQLCSGVEGQEQGNDIVTN